MFEKDLYRLKHSIILPAIKEHRMLKYDLKVSIFLIFAVLVNRESSIQYLVEFK